MLTEIIKSFAVGAAFMAGIFGLLYLFGTYPKLFALTLGIGACLIIGACLRKMWGHY